MDMEKKKLTCFINENLQGFDVLNVYFHVHENVYSFKLN
jgi:hypothetical protein